jgi:Holliday junction resolvasome RuvABC endonuclease subunit
MKVLGVDPGVINCGVVVCDIDDVTHDTRVLGCDNVDLSVGAGCLHRRVPFHECRLNHSTLADRVLHMVQEFGGDSLTHIICERQPPCSSGYTTEHLLWALFPAKMNAVSTQAIWKIYGGKGLSYEARKERATAFSHKFLWDQVGYKSEPRKHDIADALCVTFAFRATLRQADVARKRRENCEGLGDFETFDTFIAQFKCC